MCNLNRPYLKIWRYTVSAAILTWEATRIQFSGHKAGCSQFSSSSQIFILLMMQWSIKNISNSKLLPTQWTSLEILSSYLQHHIFWGGSRLTCITQVHVRREKKIRAAHEALLGFDGAGHLQLEQNQQLQEGSKIFHWVLQSFSNKGDLVWFCYLFAEVLAFQQ